MLLNFFLQKTILSVRLYLINTKPCRRPGRFPFFFRPGVCARKPNSLALPALRREPRRRLGRLFAFFRPGVRARKPNLLALPAPRREPRRHTGRQAAERRQAAGPPHGPAGAAAGATKKGKQRFRKSKSLLPLFWGLIDRIHFLYGFTRYETPSAMLSSCEGSLPGSHMRTGTALPFQRNHWCSLRSGCRSALQPVFYRCRHCRHRRCHRYHSCC